MSQWLHCGSRLHWIDATCCDCSVQVLLFFDALRYRQHVTNSAKQGKQIAAGLCVFWSTRFDSSCVAWGAFQNRRVVKVASSIC